MQNSWKLIWYIFGVTVEHHFHPKENNWFKGLQILWNVSRQTLISCIFSQSICLLVINVRLYVLLAAKLQSHTCFPLRSNTPWNIRKDTGDPLAIKQRESEESSNKLSALNIENLKKVSVQGLGFLLVNKDMFRVSSRLSENHQGFLTHQNNISCHTKLPNHGLLPKS